MTKPSNEPLQKHTLNLVAGDFQRIAELYPTVDASLIIRTLVHNFVRKHETGTLPPLPEGVEL